MTQREPGEQHAVSKLRWRSYTESQLRRSRRHAVNQLVLGLLGVLGGLLAEPVWFTVVFSFTVVDALRILAASTR